MDLSPTSFAALEQAAADRAAWLSVLGTPSTKRQVPARKARAVLVLAYLSIFAGCAIAAVRFFA